MRFSVPNRASRTSGLALAIALATGSLVGMTAFPDQAYAQKKDKKAANQGDYSKEFIAAYTPVQTLTNAPTKDYNAIKAALPAVVAATASNDEKLVTGSVMYDTGGALKDNAMRLQGAQMMLQSGKVEADKIALMNYLTFELLRNEKRNAEARTYLQAAMDNNFTYEGVSTADLHKYYAQTYFDSNDGAGGVKYLLDTLQKQEAAGQPGDEALYKFAVAKAYEAKSPQVYDVASRWVVAYPNQTNWRDAINIARNLNNYEPAEELDLLRLGMKLNTLQQKSDYLQYVDSADPRRLPKEVVTVIDHGYSSGAVDRGDTYVAEARKTAQGRLAADQAELSSLERDANKAGATARTIVAAGDTFLSYGQPAKAEAFYSKAATMAGVDTGLVLTRLGMAQIDQGKFAEANATLAKVQGNRQPIARLWSAYATEKSQATGG